MEEGGAPVIYELTAESAAGQRIDKYLSEQLADLSRSYLQKLLKDGGVEVNGKTVKSNYKLADKDQICLEVPEAVEPEIAAEPMDLDILYEDKDIILINKPKGMVVHPAAGHYTGTLVNGLMYHCKDELSGINGVMRPGIVHRIDMDTTGVLIVCKNDKAHNAIAEQLKVHSITRKYYAIVHGVIKEDDGTVNAPIGRHPVDRKKMSINEKNGKLALGNTQKKPADQKTVDPKKLKKGDSVKIISMNLKGIVNTLPDARGNLFVQCGIMRMQTNVNDLIPVKEETITAPALQRTNTGKLKMSKSFSVSSEINLLGCTVDEAIAKLDKYLDDAYLAHLPSVRVVHGKGTGALRSAVQSHLKRLKYVKEYRLGEYGEGDAGVTIVTFK